MDAGTITVQPAPAIHTSGFPPMKDILNKENLVALGIVVVGVIVASMIAPIIQGFVGKWRKPSA